MAYKCDYCKKGIGYGHMVSHAKNRLRRIFRPNLQKLKVLKNGCVVRVKFCTSCIKRLKKDGRMGVFTRHLPSRITPIIKKTEKAAKKTLITESKNTLNIESIVGKKV